MQKQINPAVQFAIDQLNWILENASGGGEFRRVIIQRIDYLKNL